MQSYIDTILVNDLTTGGTTKALTAEMGKVLKTAIDDIYQPDVLISSVAPARVGNTFTYPAGQYTYLINKVLRTLLANYIVTIDATVSTNLKRVDLIQAHADGTFSKKIGTENAIIAVRPEVDANCVPVSFINVFGNTEDIEQIDNNEAINKREVKSIAKEPSNVVEAITVNNYEISNTSDSTSFYKAYCLKELGKASFYNRIYGTKDKIFVKLKNLTYINNELYFTISLQNVSTLDYDINYLNFYITSRNKKRNTTTQTIPYKYQYVHNLPSKIRASETIDVVFVYQKFSINENKILLIEMTEDNGEREVKLEIPNTFINNPNSNNKKQE